MVDDDIFGINLMDSDLGNGKAKKDEIKPQTTLDGDEADLDRILVEELPEKEFDIKFYYNTLEEPIELNHRAKIRTKDSTISNEKAKELIMIKHPEHIGNPSYIIINYIQEVSI